MWQWIALRESGGGGRSPGEAWRRGRELGNEMGKPMGKRKKYGKPL